MARKRWSLDLPAWPPRDQEAWLHARIRRPLFQGRALAAHWAPETCVGVLQANGQWLHFLARQGWLDEEEQPCQRLTEERLAAYVSEMQARIESMSVASQLRDLGEALRVMDPEGDRSLILEAAAYAKVNARRSRDERRKLVAPSDFYDAGLERMRRFAPRLPSDIGGAMAYQGGLMMAMAISKPLRRKILCGLLVRQNLTRAEERYGLILRKGKTAKAATADAELPASLAPFLDDWINRGRPLLLHGRNHDALWLMPDGSPITPHAFSYRFCRATRDEFRVPINVHFVRNIAATGISVFEPGLVAIIQEVLDHTNDDMRKQWYDLADRLSTSRRYIELLGARRARAIERVLKCEGATRDR